VTGSAAPQIPLTVEIGSGMERLASPPVAARLQDAVAGELATVLAAVGLPGTPTVGVRRSASARAVRIRVHGVLLPFPPELLERVWRAAGGTVPDAAERDVHRTGYPDGWLRRDAAWRRSDDHAPVDPAVAVAALVRHAITRRPSCLLDPGTELPGMEVPTVVRGSAGGASPEFAGLYRMVAAALLDLGVRVPGLDRIASRLRQRPADELVEELFEQTRSHRVELHASADLVCAIAGCQPRTDELWLTDREVDRGTRDRFADVARELFARRGLRLPPLVFVPSVKLPSGTVAVRVNEHVGIPVGLPRRKEDGPNGRRAPSDGPGLRSMARRLGQQGPNRVFGGRVRAGTREAVSDHEAAVAAALSALDWEVEWAADRLVGLTDVEYMLARLEAQLPVLVHEALARLSFPVLTRTVRLLVRERASVRELSSILEGLLCYRWVAFDRGDRLVFDNRVVLPEGVPASVAETLPFLLEGARRPLASAPRDPSPALDESAAVLVLDRELEQRLERLAVASSGGMARPESSDEREELSAEQAERFRDAVWAAGGGRAPIVVTTAGARWTAHALLSPELPAATVLSRDELGPNAAFKVAQTVRLARRPFPVATGATRDASARTARRAARARTAGVEPPSRPR
jgi:FHIPEP family